MDSQKTINELKAKFKKFYGNAEEIHIFRAPGRINLIGEHIDYNGGHVLPAAIDRNIFLVARKRKDNSLNFKSLNFQKETSCSLDDSGIMDQFIISLGQREQALFLNCQNLNYELVPFNMKDISIVVSDTKKKRPLVDLGYNQRRSECEVRS